MTVWAKTRKRLQTLQGKKKQNELIHIFFSTLNVISVNTLARLSISLNSHYNSVTQMILFWFYDKNVILSDI